MARLRVRLTTNCQDFVNGLILDGFAFIPRSKTSPIPHAYIRLAEPEKQFVQGVGYDVDVELELVRPRQANSDENGTWVAALALSRFNKDRLRMLRPSPYSLPFSD